MPVKQSSDEKQTRGARKRNGTLNDATARERAISKNDAPELASKQRYGRLRDEWVPTFAHGT